MTDMQPMSMDAFEDQIAQLLDMLISTRGKLITASDPQVVKHLLVQMDGIKKDIVYLRGMYTELMVTQEESLIIQQIYQLLWELLKRLSNRKPVSVMETLPLWESLPPVLKERLDILEKILDEILQNQEALQTDVRRGFSLVYYQLDTIEQQSVEDILQAVRANKLTVLELQETSAFIVSVLSAFQKQSIVQDQQIQQAIQDMKTGVESNLGLTQKLELSLPILPFLAYNVELDLNQTVDLNAVMEEARERWKHLKDRVVNRSL